MAGTAIAIISFIIFSVLKPSNDSSREQYQDRINLDEYQPSPAKETKQQNSSVISITRKPAKPIRNTSNYPSTQTSLQSPTQAVSDNQAKRNINIREPLKKHTVTQGETLSSISLLYYGDTTHWKDILNANSNLLSNPNNLRTGMQLVIPSQTR